MTGLPLLVMTEMVPCLAERVDGRQDHCGVAGGVQDHVGAPAGSLTTCAVTSASSWPVVSTVCGRAKFERQVEAVPHPVDRHDLARA